MSCDVSVDASQLVLTIHFLPSLNFATVCVKLIVAETASTISGGYKSLSILSSVIRQNTACLSHFCHVQI